MSRGKSFQIVGTVVKMIFISTAEFNDAKKILTVLSSEDWKRPPGRPRITWMKTVLNDFESHSLTFTEAVSMA